MGTKISIGVECEELIAGLDTSAAKFENFAGKAEKSINDIDKAGIKMTENQKRVFENLTNSYFKHASVVEKLKNEYEQLRAKQKSGQELTQTEAARLQLLNKEYKSHATEIVNVSKALKIMSKEAAMAAKISEHGVSACTTLSAALGNIAANIVSFSFEKIISTGREFAELGLAAQQVSSQFAAMTGSLQQGENAYKDFNEVYRSTNYDQTAVMGMGKQLMNMGYSAQNAADLIMLCADAAAGLGQGADGAQRLVDIISKIQSTGNLSTKDIESLAESGLDMGQVFANMGMTAAEAMSGLQKGTLDSQTAIDALTKYLHTFDGKMAESKQNLKDVFGDITGNLKEIAARVGDAFASLIMDTGISQEFTDLTEGLLQGFTALCDVVKQLGKLLSPIFGEPIRMALAAVTNAIYLVGDVLKTIVVGVHDAKEAFGMMCDWVWNKLNWMLEPLSWVYDKVAGIIALIRDDIQETVNRVKDIHGQIGSRFDEVVGNNETSENNFRASLSEMVEPETEAAEKIKTAYNSVALAQKDVADQSKITINWSKELTDAFKNMGSDILKNGVNFMDGLKNAFKKFAESVINQLMNIAMKALVVNALTGLFGGGSKIISGEQFGLGKVPSLGFADGGLVSGEGTSVSDSIPAMLSNGEYVLNADAVRAVGKPQLDAINNGVRHYASGGYVGDAGNLGGRSVTVNVSAMDTSGFADYLARGGLDVIRQALFENERGFGSTVGVW